jgi:hypothetical protein
MVQRLSLLLWCFLVLIAPSKCSYQIGEYIQAAQRDQFKQVRPLRWAMQLPGIASLQGRSQRRSPTARRYGPTGTNSWGTTARGSAGTGW